MTIREMTIEDYDQVYALWMKIKGFGIRSRERRENRRRDPVWSRWTARMFLSCLRGSGVPKTWHRQKHGRICHGSAEKRTDQ